MDLTAMRAMDLDQITKLIAGATRPINVLWQTDDSIAFVARGREGRSEFHVDPSDEVMYMIKGDMNLHYRTPDGAEKVAVIREGEILHCPAGTPHSPRFANWFGTTLRIFDPSISAWRVYWFNPGDGIRAELVGRRRGNEIVQEGTFPDGTPIRWTFTEITADSFRWRGERREPDGKTWRLQVDFRAQRIVPGSAMR